MFTSIIWLNSLAAIAALAVYMVLRHDLLSRLFTILLNYRYPIKNIDNGQPLPTLPFVFPNGQGNVEKFLHGHANSVKWGREYGPLYRIWSGFHGEIVVTRPADIETVFRDSHIHIKANANDSGYLMQQLLGACLGLVSGSEWKAMRKATEPPFLHKTTASHVATVVREAKLHTQSLVQKADSANHFQIQPYADLRVYPFIALAEILYGGLTPSLKSRLLAIIPNRDNVFLAMIQGGLTRFPIARFLPLKTMRDLRAFKSAWATWNDDAHAAAVAQVEATDPNNTAAPIVQLYASVEQGAMSREALLQTLDEMLFANLDVSIGGLAWALVFLAVHPEAQARLLADIKAEVVAAGKGDAYLLSQSNFLHCVLLESGRLRPVAAFSVSQSCPSARRIGDYVFPAGTKFVVDASALNVRDELWGPDNFAFRPERWRGNSVQRAKDIRYCYWRFGFGPRVCLGKYVVDLMMKALIVEIVRDYEVSLEDEEGNGWKWDQEGTWTLDPKMRVGVTRRV